MTHILLVRHGNVEGIDPERFRGRAELELTDLGRQQAVATAERIAANWRPSAIYTSPMGRCVATARAIAASTRCAVKAMDRLNDLDYGEWQWKTLVEVRADSPVLFDRWFSAPESVRFPGGESLHDLLARTADALRQLIDEHPRETIVVVGHDSVNRAILMQVLQQSPSMYWQLVQSPCGLNEIELDHERARVVRMNETAHVENLTR